MAPKYIDMNALDGRPYKGMIRKDSEGVLSESPCFVTSFLDGSKLELKLNLMPLPKFNEHMAFLVSVATSGNALQEKIICRFQKQFYTTVVDPH
jgi:hypothetical protein